MSEPTELPWETRGTLVISGDTKEFIVDCAAGNIKEDRANAEYIVLACNSHKDLVTLLKVAKCPNCDGVGYIAHQTGEAEWEQEQCQWCYEREEAIKKAKP